MLFFLSVVIPCAISPLFENFTTAKLELWLVEKIVKLLPSHKKRYTCDTFLAINLLKMKEHGHIWYRIEGLRATHQ